MIIVPGYPHLAKHLRFLTIDSSSCTSSRHAGGAVSGFDILDNNNDEEMILDDDNNQIADLSLADLDVIQHDPARPHLVQPGAASLGTGRIEVVCLCEEGVDPRRQVFQGGCREGDYEDFLCFGLCDGQQ